MHGQVYTCICICALGIETIPKCIMQMNVSCAEATVRMRLVLLERVAMP